MGLFSWSFGAVAFTNVRGHCIAPFLLGVAVVGAAASIENLNETKRTSA